MTFTYSLGEPHYLHYLFYSTAQSKRVVKRRAINKLVLMAMVVITGIFLYTRNGPIASAAFFILCLPLYFLYNTFERRQYQKHFTKFIRLHFQEMIDKAITLNISDNEMTIIDQEKNRILFTDIESITETKDIYIIQHKDGNAFLIAKENVTPAGELSQQLTRIATDQSIPYKTDLEWKWK